ncbi:MAG: PAS domain S-box protein [Spirochaetota bacterium]|nr:PAS domain S-box protein [Spirochaetota bacterium]
MHEYLDIFDHTGTALAIIDQDNLIHLVNGEFEKLSGYSKAELEGKISWLSFISEKDLNPMLVRHENRLKDPAGIPSCYEFDFTNRDGKELHTLLTVNLIDEGARTIVSLIDISEHKRREQLIEYRLALEELIGDISREFINMPSDRINETIIHTLEQTGRFVDVDRSYIFLIAEDGRTMSNTHEWCAPGVSPQKEILQDLPLSDFNWIISVLQRNENINITSLDQLPPEAGPEKNILEIQDIQSLAIVPIHFGGILKGYFGFDSTRKKMLWNDEDFTLLRTIGDIIVRGLMQQKLESRLIQSQKMEALGRLAGSIAHDFNNILTTIKGHSQLLLYSSNIQQEDRELINTITEATESGAQLTNRLLAVSRDQRIVPKEIRLNSAIENSRKLFERLIPDNIELTTYLNANSDKIKAEPSQVEQIVMNLVLNSADAMPEGGKLRITTQNVKLLKNSLLRQGGIKPGDYVLFQVIDNGHGMDERTLEKALEPFFTTKQPGKGNGLGLPTVYTIVEQYGGYMDIFSSLNLGTRIDIYLPVSS